MKKIDTQKYYGEILNNNNDLKTEICKIQIEFSKATEKFILNIHEEVKEKYYGCGLIAPTLLEGMTILDLGCGSGFDCYLLSQLVGEKGKVIGIDITKEQIEVAKKYEDYHKEKFGFKKANTSFIHADISEIDQFIEENSVDIIVSNCVFNLLEQKQEIFKKIFKLLKKGGELFFSDIFSDRRLAKEIKDDFVLQGECIGGAMYIEDFRRMHLNIGINDIRVYEKNIQQIKNREIALKLGATKLESITWSIFNIDLEDRCENYGQIAIYQGTIPDYPEVFKLDAHHFFEKGKPVCICGNTFDLISKSRFSKHFSLLGEKNKHFGIFPCEIIQKKESEEGIKSSLCC